VVVVVVETHEPAKVNMPEVTVRALARDAPFRRALAPVPHV
jgi:hypothetical protein